MQKIETDNTDKTDRAKMMLFIENGPALARKWTGDDSGKETSKENAQRKLSKRIKDPTVTSVMVTRCERE